MEELLYEMIFKRKSFHIFKGEKHLSDSEVQEIRKVFCTFKPLVNDIKVDIEVVPREETSCKRGEYCILLYSEKKDNYLANIGYLGEQLDLWLASKNIGVCWYGMGKTEEIEHNNLAFVIMLAIEKVDENQFRKDMFKSKRKELSEIWEGKEYPDIAEIVRFAPSACNTQPWIVENSENKLDVFRYKKAGKRGMMPADKVTYYNRIDIGIFLLFLELCFQHENVKYERTVFADTTDDSVEKTLVATYFYETKNT